jgi:VWFA-related protein
MSRVLTLLGSALLLTTAVLGAGQEAQFRSATHTVSIYATVLDEDGRLVPGLARDDFEVFDNGQRRELSLFANDLQPITIVVMLDRSGSMAAHFGLVRDAAEVFVENLLPDDKARIGSFSERILIDPEAFTSDKDELKNVLRHKLQSSGPTPLWRATSAAMDALSGQDGRRVVLMFTDGKDSPALGPTTTFDDVRTRAQVEEIMVYGIGLSEGCGFTAPSGRPGSLPPGIVFQRAGPRRPGGQRPLPPGGGFPGIPRLPVPGRGLPPRLPPVDPTRRPSTPPMAAPCLPSAPDPDLRELADVGGGGYFELRSTNDLRTTFARVADELHQQYLLGFTADQLDNTLHHLEVRVKQPNMSTRARSSYMAAAR